MPAAVPNNALDYLEPFGGALQRTGRGLQLITGAPAESSVARRQAKRASTPAFASSLQTFMNNAG